MRAYKEVIPFPPSESADEYAQRQAADAAVQEATQKFKDAVSTAREDQSEQLRDHTRYLIEQEDARQNSVMSRAQSLFFAVAFLTAFLAVSGTLLISGQLIMPTAKIAIATISALLLLQVFLLSSNVLRVIGGYSYLRPGLSDATKWATAENKYAIFRDQSVLMRGFYVDAVRKNTWRFICLNNAIVAFRNIVVLTCFLISILSVAVFFIPPQSCRDESEFEGAKPIKHIVVCTLPLAK
jgi:hypothetical protein